MVALVMEEAEERPVHQGCMAGFLHLFDRPQILSGRRFPHAPRRLTSSSSGSATPSERSMPLDRAPSSSSSPDSTSPPSAPRPSLQIPPPLDGPASGVGAAPSWRLPRLSLDSRAVVDGRGKYRPRDVRAPSPAHAPPSPCGADTDRRSPSVVARLMGLDALPHGPDGHDAAAASSSPGQLRRSASERVPTRGGDHHHQSRFRFVDPAFFERPPASPQPSAPAPPVAAAATAESAAAFRAPDPTPRGMSQRRSRFDAREVFPEPAKRAADAPGGGEIALYGEIERRLRKRGIAEPARDLETLKQVLEALQLKGLLRHHTRPTPHAVQPLPPPPIVLMRPSHRGSPSPHHSPQQARVTPAQRLRADVVDRRPLSPDPSASPARSPASPARRGPQSPQRRVASPAQSPKLQPLRKSGGFDAAGARSRIARRAAQNNHAALFPDEEASTTACSDGGSSGSLSSRWDMEPPPVTLGDETSRKLERCGKLLSSIQAFTGGEASAADQQPSPVSVLDAASFLADEDSPSSSSGSKRVIDFNLVRSPPPKPAAVAASASSDQEDDQWVLSSAGPDACDPDYAYVAELVRLLLHHRSSRRDPADAYKIAERQRRLRLGCVGKDDADTCHHRRLLCGAVAEALDRQRSACPWDPASWLRFGSELVDHVWAEVRRAREPVVAASESEDLNDVTCNAIRRDLSSSADDGLWASTLQGKQRRRPGAEVADAVLQIERLVFKDLVADTIRELADADRLVPRRKLIF